MKKSLIFLCIVLLLLGCTACSKKPAKGPDDNGTQGTPSTDDTSSGLGQEIIIDDDFWDNPTSSKQQGGSAQTGNQVQTTTSTSTGAASTGNTTSGGTIQTSSSQTGSSATGSKNVININSSAVHRDDSGWSEWK